MKTPTVIVSRCDRIGDLILSLPALGLLRDAGITRRVLHCLPYCADIAELARANRLCTDVWIAGQVAPTDLTDLEDAYGIALFHAAESVRGFRELKLRRTLGPRSKLSALWSYRKTLAQHRSRVEKSEMHYNLDLVRAALKDLQIPVPEFRGISSLEIPQSWSFNMLKSADVVLVVANRGSAENWPIETYIALAEEHLSAGRSVDFLVSGIDAAERRKALELHGVVARGARVVGDFSSLAELAVYLARAGRVVSSSTGPLHLAHALGRPVLGIYPKARVRSFDRWRPDGYWHNAEVRYVEI